MVKTFTPASFFFFIALLLAGGVAALRGQSALDGFDPNANGLVRVVVVQPDGKILLGGDFTTLSPNGGAVVARNRIARLNPDGTLDDTFSPNANGSVYAIAVQADGMILVGGVFTTLLANGGAAVTRNRIGRLNAEYGTVDASFDPNANNAVLSIAVQADGRILAGGDFTSMGALARNRMARLDAVSGAADLQFDPSANSSVWSIVVRPDGKLLVGGSFTDIGGQVRNSMARLNPDATLDTNFNPNANGSVRSIAVQADGRILAGGQFTSIGGQTRNRIARLDPATGAADSFNPDASSDVRSIALQPDGKIVAGGFFFTISGQSRSQIARLNPDGTADSLNPAASSPVHAVAVQSDGKILAGGQFLTIGGETRNRIARLEKDGRLDRTLNLNMVSGVVSATAVQPDGKILIGGTFTNVLGVTRSNLARLHTDGTLDTTFDPKANGSVGVFVVQPDGKILLGGAFTTLSPNGGAAVTRNRVARVHADGTLDLAFNPNATNAVLSIAVQADGKILVGGRFSGANSIGGQTRNYIARLDATTGLADAFNPNADGAVFSLAVQTDGKILAGGAFNSIGEQTRNYIARLNATTGLADTFNPNFMGDIVLSIVVQPDGKILAGGIFSFIVGDQFHNGMARMDAAAGLVDDSFSPDPYGGTDHAVYSMAVQADGKILAGGDFEHISGFQRDNFSRLYQNGGLDTEFYLSANSDVLAVALQADGKILIGGFFASIDGQPRRGFARLGNNTAALQYLDVSQSTVTWIRGGSSSELTRVTFESSTNNVNYTPLGSATAAGSNWTLTDLNLPTARNLYIRARGFYRTGYANSSESITESVRNAFIVAQPRLNIQRSANTNVVLSWATNFTGFTLESKTNLNTNVWSVVTNAPAVSGTNNAVTNAANGAARFYRLRK